MMQEIEHIFERLRSGTVPEKGFDKFAIGIDKPLNEIRRQLNLISKGEGAFKFLRGGCGCGKTFMSQYTSKKITIYVCEIKFRNIISKKVIVDVQEKINRLNVPKGFSVRPVLIYSCELEKSIQTEDFFDQLICFDDFLIISEY